jgi:hypothetical protein
MAKLTKAEAARQLGIARSTLYKIIAQGKVSATPDGMIDQAELVRIAAYVDTLHERTRTSVDAGATPLLRHVEIPRGRPQADDREQLWTDVRERPQTSSDALVDILREQIQILRDELQEARQERQAAREREAVLLRMVEQMQHRYDRLLEAPRQTPGTAPEARAPSVPEAPRGAMRQRIVALLREYPEGLTPAEIRTLLDVDRSLTDTVLGMLRYGLVRRVGRGKYVVAAPSRHER